MAETADDFFGADASQGPAAQPPSAQDFFAGIGNYSGAAHDTIWSDAQNAGAHILNKLGQGFEYGWGSEPLGVSKDDEAALAKAGIFNDYKIGNESFMKTANEALIRPAVALGDVLSRTARAPFYAVGAASQQAAQEIQGEHPMALRTALATPFGGLGEIAGSVPEGFIPEGVAGAPRVAEVNRARSLGVVGESEEGFHETAPLTPEHAAARAQAAREAGIEPYPVAPPVQDVLTLARQIDPETFRQYDALADERQHYQTVIDQMGTERATSPEAVGAKAQIDTILGKVRGVESRLTDAARGRLEEAQATLDRTLNRDTPDMREARSYVSQVNYQMQPLFQRVQDAYRAAQEMLPKPEETEAAKPNGEIPAEGGELGHGQAAVAEGEKQPPGTISDNNGEISPLAHDTNALPPEAQRGIDEANAGLSPAAAVSREIGAAGPENGTGQTTAKPGAEAAPEGEPTKPQGRATGPKPIEGTGDVRERGLAQSVRARALAQGFADEFGALPEYHQMDFEEQAEEATKLLDSDPERAKDIAMGRRQPPKGLLARMVFRAVEDQARASGDFETVLDLGTKSKLIAQSTEMGREIAALGYNFDPLSPVNAISAVKTAREGAFAAKGADLTEAVAKEAADAKASVRAAASTKADWSSFISSVECGG